LFVSVSLFAFASSFICAPLKASSNPCNGQDLVRYSWLTPLFLSELSIRQMFALRVK
jgi:hypothetical protein